MSSPGNVLSGGRSPQVRSVPRYSVSAGREAIELAASAGLYLYPWQQDVLIDALAERPDGRWLTPHVAVIVARQNGKGAILEARELAGLFLFGERHILHTAHEMRTSFEAFRRIVGLIEGCADLSRRVKGIKQGNGKEGIELLNGARLQFIARSKGSGRGFSGDCLIYDEAYALTDEQVDASTPTLSAQWNYQTWYTSSPPLDAATGEPLYRMRDRALKGEDERLAYFDWGAESGVDLDDPGVWAATNPSLGYRIELETIVDERAAMTDEGFGRERLCIWPKRAGSSWAVIPEADWRALADSGSELADPVAFAIDVTPDRSMTAIAVAGRRADGLGHVEVVDHRRGTGWVVERVLELKKRWKPCAVVIDVTGPAGSLVGDLEAEGVELVKPFSRQAAAACGAFWDAICGKDDVTGEPLRALRHLDQPMLATALAGAVKRPLADTWAWNRKDTTVDISPLVAVTLAHWGHANYWNSGPLVMAGDLFS